MHCHCFLLSIAMSLAAQAPATPPQGQPPEPQPRPPVTVDDGAAPALPELQEPATTAPAPATPVVLTPRIRDITRLNGVMPHLLNGLGVVTGLASTGSSDRATRQAILNFIRDHDLNIPIADVVGGNTALVSITASLPPFAKQGQPLPVKVQTIGDATSLRGGDLLRAELRGVDNLCQAVAQGPVLVGGFAAQGTNASVQKNLSTTGWVNDGIVVRDMPSSFFSESGALELQVQRPSAFNAAAIAEGIRKVLAADGCTVRPVDTTLVRIELPEPARTNEAAIAILNRIGEVRVRVENPAKVVVDQSSGTVLAGEGVLISPCVVGLTDLTISVVNEEDVVQPNPFGTGDTARVGRTRIEVKGDHTDLKPVAGGATVADLLQNLRALGLTPAQLVSVFAALDAGGFLHATLEVR